MKNWPVCSEYMLNEASKDVYQHITADLTKEITVLGTYTNHRELTNSTEQVVTVFPILIKE